MEIMKLCIVFAVIVAVLWKKRPLFLAISAGLAAVIALYGIPLGTAAVTAGKAAISKETITVVLSFYFITFLQRMLEQRRRLKEAEEALEGLFNSRRVNSSLAPAVIGLLPSAGAMTICGAMVDSACGDYLSREDKTFITSFFRHVPESFLPTYSSILIAMTISNTEVGAFVLAMLPMVAALFLLGYIFYLRKIPKRTGAVCSQNKKGDLYKLFRSLWSVVLIVALILMVKMPVHAAVPMVIILEYFVDRLTVTEVRPMFKTAFEPNIIVNTILIMMFKDMITSTGVISQLPAFFGQFPIPLPITFALIFFFGTIIGGSTAIIVLCLPMAMATVPGAGLPLVVLLMCFSYASMQISPTHVCLFIVAEYFHTNLGDLIKRTIPVLICFCGIVLVYYQVLAMFL